MIIIINSEEVFSIRIIRCSQLFADIKKMYFMAVSNSSEPYVSMFAQNLLINKLQDVYVSK